MRLTNISIQDCVNVKYICKVICRRSAYLISAATSAIINRMAVSPVTIAFDGTVYRKHPKYKELLKEKIKVLIDPNITVNMIFTSVLMIYSVHHVRKVGESSLNWTFSC